MRIVESFPRGVRVIENVWIPMRDGVRLAARLWLPEDAERHPVPALLEYIPYRKRDGTRERDEPMHGYFAGHGYASLRVDLRGAGDSEGLLLDEYLPQEQDDGEDAIAWIARQPWCSGAVGMLGKSWGGFNALQIAARRPPALRAVISVCSTDDRYADDAHYMGGCLLNENLVWGTLLMGLAAQPPDPELAGPGWLALWEQRLARAELHPATWMAHRRRDDYWRQGSVCEDFDAIGCPVFLVGGWADAYTNAIPRLLAGLSVPRRGLIGPWAHLYPHQGTPGPAIGFLQEALRWWDRWLADDARGTGGASGDELGTAPGVASSNAPVSAPAPAPADDEPLLRAWMPGPDGERGRWVAEDRWPSPHSVPRVLHLGPGSLQAQPAAGHRATHRSPETVGLAAGAWCRFGHDDDAPGEQSEDDAGSLCFDGEPLSAGFEILGAPRLALTLSVDRPVAFVVVRLCDVAPDGRSTRVTWGLLDLGARDGLDRSTPLRPGERLAVELALGDVAHHFAPGHRLRLAVSTNYWPLVWPSPEAVTLTLFSEGSRVELPERPAHDEDAALRDFDPPEGAPPPEQTDLHVVGTGRSVSRDAATGEVLYTVRTGMDEQGRVARWREDDIELHVGQGMVERFSIRDGEPLSARVEIEHVGELHRGAWSVRVVTRTRLTATATHFRLEAELDAHLGEQPIARRFWDRELPRDGR